MGTNSKSSHENYAVSPTVVAEPPPAPVDLGKAEPPVPADGETEVLTMATGALDSAAQTDAEQHGPAEGADALAEAAAGQQEAAPDAEPVVSEAVGQQFLDDLDQFLAEQQEAQVQDAGDAVAPVQEAGEAPGAGEEDGVQAESLAQGADPAGDIEEVEEEEEEPGEQPLTPVPEAPPLGVPAGTPVLVGGEDFIDSQATLMAYDSKDGPREVLLAHVTPEAEGKLLEALSVPGSTMVDVVVDEQVTGPLQLDKDLMLAQAVKSATTSVQHKLQNGLPMSEQSIHKHQVALDKVNTALASPTLTDEEKAMGQYYLDQLNQIGEKIQNGGAQLPWMEPYKATFTKQVTKQVPAPAEEAEEGTLAAQLRSASRIKATLDPETGQSSWDGKARSAANGKEYAVDLGEGWSAVYRPYAGNDPSSSEFSMRGQLEVHAPPGAGHGKEMVERLEQLHLVNKPMTASEGEWTYLTSNITAQGLSKATGMKSAFAEAQGLEDLQVQELVHQRTADLVGLDEGELHQQIKRIQLEAARTVLPKKVAVLREAVAKATGFADGQALASSAGYDPVPSASGGWLTWSRFDVTGNTAEIKEAFKGKSLTHSIGSGNMLKVFGTGVLASTEKRAVMGIGSGVGMSEQADKGTGGANSVFLRVAKTPSSNFGGQLIWDDPSVLMRRADYYAYDGDKYGVSPDKKSAHGLTRNPLKIATHTASNNEIMFRDGVDLLGAEAPSRIVCGPASERTALLESFKSRGITHLGGKPVEEVVQSAY